MAAAKAIYTSLTGFSPLMAEEVCCRAGIDGGFAVNALEENAKLHLFRTFSYLIEDIKNGAFTPNIVYQGDEPKEFSALKLTQYQDLREETYDSISGVLETYYAMKTASPASVRNLPICAVSSIPHSNGMSKNTTCSRNS